LLLMSEVALAVVLLVGAGLVLKSLWRLQNVDAGFRGAGVLRMRVNFPVGKYRERGRLVPFYERAVAEVRALPEVRSAGAVACPPLGGTCWEAIFAVEGQTVERSQAPTARFNAVAGDYFGVMGIRLRRGRMFTEADYASAAPLVIVNSNLARRFWPDSDPVGRRIKIGWPPTGPGSWLEVVGVIQDMKRDTLAEPAHMEAFLMHTNAPRPFMELVVRTEVPPLTLARSVQSAIWRADRDALIYDVSTMDDVRAASLVPVRVPTFIVGAFAVLALILATAGVYSLVAFAVTQRLGEMAIRLVLGATGRELLLMICRQALMPVAAGLAIGAAGGWAFGRVLSGLLFDVQATDSLTYTSVLGIVAIVASTAAIIPATRALRVDLISVLRMQ
jgi:putative ABC transport system permease protein